MDTHQDLNTYINSLKNWLVSEWGVPLWKEVLLIEDATFDPDPLRIEVGECFSLDAYQIRFQELLGRGYSWINLSALGFFEQAMLIHVEYPNSEYGNASNTRVNFSGPNRAVTANGYQIFIILKDIGQS